MTRDIKWVEWKITDPAETMKMFCGPNKDNLVPGIKEEKTPTSEPEDKLPVHIIPDEGESMRPNEKSKSSEFTYHKKYDNTDMPAYDRVLNALKKLGT